MRRSAGSGRQHNQLRHRYWYWGRAGIPDADLGTDRYSATTDTLGHFLFENVKTGIYGFGYTSPNYLSSDPMPARRRVEINGDQTSVKLEGHMTALPLVSGRVVDGAGNGIANALVKILGRNDPPLTTDAEGRFNLRLTPGSYILAAYPPAGLKPPDPEPDSGRVLVWAQTFYPGVALLESASRIVLRPGSEFSGIVIKLLAVPSHPVRGILLNPDGTPAPGATVTLSEQPQSASGHTMFAHDPATTLRTQTNADGAFDFPKVVAGAWRLAAEIENGGEKLRAARWIDMAGHEVEQVKLRLAAPFALHGQVVIETPNGAPTPALFSFFLLPHGRPLSGDTGMGNWMLFPSMHFEPAIPRDVPEGAEVRKATEEIAANQLSDELGAMAATPGADGRFSLTSVYPGSYRIFAMPPPPPYYMAAVRVGEASLTAAETDLSSGAAPITIVYKADGGSVSGVAEKCAGGLVLLIPQDPNIQSLGFLRSGRCDANDKYDIPAVRPGDYYALAFAEPGGMPQLDDFLISQADKVAVHPNETVSINLRVIPRPGY